MDEGKLNFDLTEELNELEADLVRDPENARTWRLLASLRGLAYSHAIRGEITGREPNADHNVLYEQTIFAARKAVEFSANDAQAYLNLAHHLSGREIELETLEWSRLNLEERLTRPRHESFSHVTLEVRELYEKVLSLEPGDGLAILALSRDSLAKGELDIAEELASRLVTSAEQESVAYKLLLCEIDLKRGRFDSAIARYCEILVLPSCHGSMRVHLIEAYRLAGYYEEMLTQADAVLKEFPKANGVYKTLSLYYESQGDNDTAAAMYKTYVELTNEEFMRNLDMYFETLSVKES